MIILLILQGYIDVDILFLTQQKKLLPDNFICIGCQKLGYQKIPESFFKCYCEDGVLCCYECKGKACTKCTEKDKYKPDAKNTKELHAKMTVVKCKECTSPKLNVAEYIKHKYNCLGEGEIFKQFADQRMASPEAPATAKVTEENDTSLAAENVRLREQIRHLTETCSCARTRS